MEVSFAKVFVQINEKWIWALGNHCVLTLGLYCVIRSTAVLIFLSVLFPICDEGNRHTVLNIKSPLSTSRPMSNRNLVKARTTEEQNLLLACYFEIRFYSE